MKKLKIDQIYSNIIKAQELINNNSNQLKFFIYSSGLRVKFALLK